MTTTANISWITDQIATGGDFSFDPNKASQQLDDLLQSDIDLVIDCRVEANDQAIWDQTPVSYLHLPVNDDGNRLPTEHFDRAVEAAESVLDGGGKVFVHCHMGINRGPSTAMALLLHQRMPATKAFDLIRAKRPEAAIYYAMDAMDAHLLRKKYGANQRQIKRNKLRAHINRVFTYRERIKVQHIIRANHNKDRDELTMA